MFNDKGGSRTDTLIKLVLVFFLSLLSFSVGTFVGKQFSDSQHKIAELESSGSADRSTASIPSDAAKPEVNQAISEDEISKLSNEFIKKEKEGKAADDTSLAKEGQPVGEEKAEIPTKAKKEAKNDAIHDEIAEVSKKLAKGERVEAPKKAKSRIPSSLPEELADSSLGKYTVQVSSHQNETEAKEKAASLKEKGFSAFYVPAPVKGKTWYRVSVGLFDDKKAATEFRTKLMQEAHLESAIVQKVVADPAARKTKTAKAEKTAKADKAVITDEKSSANTETKTKTE